MQESKKRIEWIDAAKFICIMCVMLSHLESCTDALYLLFRPFFLSMFFFASGYVYQHRSGFKGFLVHKLKGLFVPWFVFSVFNILLSQVVSFNAHADIWNELKWNFLQIRAKGDGVWFVAALFASYLPFYFVVSMYEKCILTKERNKVALLFLLLVFMYIISIIYSTWMNPALLPWGSAALPWHIDYIPQALLFMFLGYLFRNKYECLFDAKTAKQTLWLWLAAYLLLVYVPAVLDIKIFDPIEIAYEHLMKPLGIVVLILLCKRIKVSKYIAFVGSNTLTYFALHGKVYSLGQTIIRKIAPGIYGMILDSAVLSSIFAVVFVILISVILILPAYIIKRWFPFVLGKKYERKTVS